MLSADVPEFVPRAYQNLGHPSNTPTSKPEGRTPQPQQTTGTSRAHKPPPGSRFGLTRAPETSWREGRETESGSSYNLPKQNDAWRRSGRESVSWREGQTQEGSRHERGTEALPHTHSGPPKSPEKQVQPKGRGRGKPTSADLESQIRSKFVTASKNMTHSYTQILKHKPQNSKPETKPSKQDFSITTDSQWPTLTGPQPQNLPNQSSEGGKRETVSNPWESRSSEVSSTKSPTKSPQNPWQEKGAAEPTQSSPAVRPKNTKEHHKPSENAAKMKLGIPKSRRSAEMKASPSVGKKLEGTRKHTLENLCDGPKTQNSDARSALKPEDETSSGAYKDEEPDKVTKSSPTEDDSDPFQWKVIGEKKKVKMKENEVHGSPRCQELRSDGKKSVRYLPDKSSPRIERKQAQEERKQALGEGRERKAQEYSGKVQKSVVVSMLKNKSLHSVHQAQGENTRDLSALKSGLKEGRKSRPTKVASLANCSSDQREMRAAKKSSAIAAAKPMDEETLQRKLAAKLIKQEEKKKKRERKAKQALMENRPKDTKVSFITADLLESCNQQTPNQQAFNSQRGEGMTFTSEEYPALQMQRNPPPRLPVSRITQAKTKQWPDSSNKTMPSTHVKVPGGDPGTRHNKGDTRIPEKSARGWEDLASTYKTALLAAKEKEKTSVTPALTRTEVDHGAPTETVLRKKNVKTTDRIQLDLFALAAHTAKKKKKNLLEEEYSPTKRKPLEEQKDQAGRTGFAVPPMMTKGAAVVAKRGKISTKPKKKKISRIKKCQIEKKQRDILALQLLLEQAKLRTAQQTSLETPPLTHTEPEESHKEGDTEENSTNDQLASTQMTEEHEEKTDDKEGQSPTTDTRERETEDEENKENTRTTEVPLSTLNTNYQTNNKAPNNNDGKPKIVWVLNKTKNANPQSEVQNDSGMKAENKEEDKSGTQQPPEEGSPASPASPAHKESLMNDPLVVQRASELVSLVKSQSLSQKSPRKYIHQVVTPEVNEVAKELMKSLIAFQARHYQREPVKARIKRRYVCGLKETTKLMGKMSCIIMAPNIEQCEGPGSLDDAVEKLLNQAEKHKVPVVFALSMRVMRKLCHKNGKRVSCFGIISYQGAQDLFKRLMELLPEAQKQYQELVSCGQCSVPKEGDDDDEEEEEGKQEVKKDLTEEIITRTNALLKAS